MSNSDAWYLDCGFSAWVGSGLNWCSPYKNWQKVYEHKPSLIARAATGVDTYARQVLGGEVAAWSEQMDSVSLDFKVSNWSKRMDSVTLEFKILNSGVAGKDG